MAPPVINITANIGSDPTSGTQDYFIYTGSFDNTVRKHDSDGNEIWVFSGHTNSVTGVAVDSNGVVYSASRDNTVRKIDSSGNQLWSVDTSADLEHVSIDPNGNVFVVRLATNDQVHKYDASGNFVWSQQISHNAPRVVKYNPTDGLIYGDYFIFEDLGSSVNVIHNASATDDSAGNVYFDTANQYAFFSDYSSNTIRRFNTGDGSGFTSQQYTAAIGFPLIIDSNDRVYFSNPGSNEIRYTDIDLTAGADQIFVTGLSGNPIFINVDSDDNIIIGTNTPELLKYDSSGNQIFAVPTNHSTNINNIAIGPG